jgi:hypothetical protein
VRQILSIRHLRPELHEHSGIEAKSSVKIPAVSRRFARVRLAAVNKKYLPRGRSVQRTLIRVLLDAFFDQGYDKVFVRMAREPVLHITRVDDFSRVSRTQAINPNQLCSLRHSKNDARQGLVTPIKGSLILNDSPEFDLATCRVFDSPSLSSRRSLHRTNSSDLSR